MELLRNHLDFEMQEKGLVYLIWTEISKKLRHTLAMQNIESKKTQY